MNEVAAASSGKSHGDENFPVAALLAPRYRAPVLAFYHFVRAADDVADHATLAPERKLALLEGLARALAGEGPDDPIATPLRRVLEEWKLPPRHALDLIEAFKLDVTKTRYRDFDDLVDYCRLSAMPVGRYVLDLHGESRDTWKANDALCAALQIINHLQDCGKDFRGLNRVYLPQDTMLKHGANVEMLGAAQSAPPLRATIVELARRTQELLDEGAGFSAQIRDVRLSMNVAAIHKLAERLTAGLLTRDPLSEKVHASRAGFAMVAFGAAGGALLRRGLSFVSGAGGGSR